MENKNDIQQPINWRSRIVKYGKIRAGDITPHPNNPRKHPQLQREAVAASFDELGQIAPILINVNNGYLIDGEERSWLALGQGDDVEVDAIWVDLSEEEHNKALVYFDATGDLATYDAERLNLLLADVNSDNSVIQQMIADLKDVAISDMPAEVTPDAGAQIDRAAELQQVWQTERGQLWVIPSKTGKGEHRLLCGDSTNADDVARVMGGECADLWIADPPYGIEWSGSNASTLEWEQIEGDADLNAATSLIQSLDIDQPAVIFGANCFPSLLPHRGRWLCWDKRLTEEADRMLGSPFELAWMNKQTGFDMMIRVLHGGVVNADGGQRYHPTQKPTLLYSEIMNTYDAKVIYDPFLGSGTTLVACEQTGRLGRGLELEAKYCAVILQRLADMGLTPQLAEST